LSTYNSYAVLTGRVMAVPPPTVRNLSTKTKVLVFKLAVVETWHMSGGPRGSHQSEFFVEVLGAQADQVNLVPGQWVTVNARPRQEWSKGREFFKFRAFEVLVGDEAAAAREDAPGNVRMGDARSLGVRGEEPRDQGLAGQSSEGDERQAG
jgi:hypothetical protein